MNGSDKTNSSICNNQISIAVENIFGNTPVYKFSIGALP